MATLRFYALGRAVTTAAVLLTLGVAFSACDSVPLVAPGGSALSLVSTTNVLPVNGSTEIIAFIVEGAQQAGTGGNAPPTTSATGTPVHDGTHVTFTTSLGRMEPSEALTQNGRATTKLIADGRSGTATITAFSGAAKNTLEVKIGAAGAARVLVTATPQSLPATGGTATINARVEDQQGNGLLGVPVSFSTTAGTLASTSVISGDSGLASTTLSTTAAATVTASAGGGTSGTLTNTVAITIKPRTTVTLTVPASANVSTPASFTVGVGANTIVTNVKLDFGDGESVPLGAVSTNTNVVHIYGSPGTFEVTATATDSDGITTPVTSQVAVLPLSVTGTASPTAVVFGGSVLLSVTVTPAGAAIAGYDWDFGEGQTITTQSPQTSWIPQTRGTKTVIVRVRPVKGAPLTVILQVNVS
jgi:hypothetical protein